MTHVVGFPGQTSGWTSGAPVQHYHEAFPIDHVLTHPADHAVAYVEEGEGESGYHHIVDGHGHFAGGGWLEVALAQILEIHERFVGQACDKEGFRNPAAVVDQ